MTPMPAKQYEHSALCELFSRGAGAQHHPNDLRNEFCGDDGDVHQGASTLGFRIRDVGDVPHSACRSRRQDVCRNPLLSPPIPSHPSLQAWHETGSEALQHGLVSQKAQLDSTLHRRMPLAACHWPHATGRMPLAACPWPQAPAGPPP